ncbi:MAG: SufB/SufD family protein [Anaerostipes sp.]|jgi:Fe-S cluster assembly scaffold protein SufB
MDAIQKSLLEAVADLHEIPTGAYNIRANGQSVGRASSEHVEIVPKEGGKGIDIYIKEGTKNESVHIPVVLSQSGLTEMVYNDFHIGKDCDVTIIAGCGIHNSGDADSKHDGIHTFYLEENAKIKYVEKHYGSGDGNGQRVMNPETVCHLAKNSYMEMETVQIKGVDSTIRKTIADLAEGATLTVTERLMTHGSQIAESQFDVSLDGDDSGAHVVSRSVARDQSKQVFISKINGNAKCNGHTECDAIIVGNANISAIPEITANNSDAALVHEAAIGKIAGEQIIKLMTLGLTQEEAEEEIINGFLK